MTERAGRKRGARKNPFKRAVRWAQESIENAAEVMRVTRETPSIGAPFEIVDRDRIHKLRRYTRADSIKLTASAPVLLVPPLMLTAEIYDMDPDLSCVNQLTKAGVDAWVVDFGAPETEEGGMERTLDDHVRTVAKAVETVKRVTGHDVHLAGYSQGGMFCYQAAAYLRSKGIASLITFGSPVDVHRNLPLAEDATKAMVRVLGRAIDKPLKKLEGLPGTLTSTGFKLLTPRKEIEQLVDMLRMLHNRQELEKRAMRRRFLGGEGFVAWPGPALRTLIDEFVVHNRLMQGGFVIDGHAITLADITTPVLMFVGTRDDIARPAAVRGIRRAAPLSEIAEIDVAAGHFGLVIGSRALRETWPSVIEWVRWKEGKGAIPHLLRPKEAPPEDSEEGSDAWDFSLSLDYELVADTISSTVSSLFKRIVGRVTDASDTAAALRFQVPRLRRLEQIQPDTMVSVARELATRAKESPNATFFLWQSRAFAIAEADQRVSNVVRGLFHTGVKPGERVAIVMNGRPSLLTMASALNRMNAVAVVVPPDASDAAISAALASSDVSAVTTDPENAARVRALTSHRVLVLGGGGARTVAGDVIDMEAIDPGKVVLPPDFRPDEGKARDLAMVLFTETDTGELRPSPITNHRWAFSALGAAAACTLTERDTVYSCLPLHHPAGLLLSVGAALVGGARLALGSPFSPEKFWPEVRRYGATVVFYAGEMARDLLYAQPQASDRSHPLRLFAGSGMRADLATDLRERFGAGILEFYASSSHNVVFANASGKKLGAVGRPLPGTADVEVVRYDFEKRAIARDEHGRVVRTEALEPGAAIVRASPSTEASDVAQRIESAFADGDHWFLLRDILMRDEEGDHFFIESRGRVIATREGPVFPRAIEDALYRLPSVRRAVVQLSPDNRVVASVVSSVALDPSVIGATLAESLPERARPDVVRQVESLRISPGFRVLPADLAAGALAELRLGSGGYER